MQYRSKSTNCKKKQVFCFKRGFALGKCLYAAKPFGTTGLHFPYTRGSGTKARPSCLNTCGCFPSSRIQAVWGEWLTIEPFSSVLNCTPKPPSFLTFRAIVPGFRTTCLIFCPSFALIVDCGPLKRSLRNTSGSLSTFFFWFVRVRIGFLVLISDRSFFVFSSRNSHFTLIILYGMIDEGKCAPIGNFSSVDGQICHHSYPNAGAGWLALRPNRSFLFRPWIAEWCIIPWHGCRFCLSWCLWLLWGCWFGVESRLWRVLMLAVGDI